MSKFFKRINNGFQHRLSQMAKFGESKHAAKQIEREKFKQEHGNLHGYNPTKVDGIYSINTMETYRKSAEIFAKWLSENTNIKNSSQVTREMACQYLKERGDSVGAWTVGRDMAAINKLYDWNLNRKELGLKDRKQSDIKRSRHACSNDRYIDRERYAKQIDFARGCGCRRQSVLKVRAKDIEWRDGRAVGVRLLEKGGRERTAPILNCYKDRITEIVQAALQDDPTGSTPLFTEYDKYIDNHSFRAEYAASLMHQLEDERAAGVPLFGGDFEPERLINLKGTDRSDDLQYRGHERTICAAVSGALGHNRLRILFDSYMHKY